MGLAVLLTVGGLVAYDRGLRTSSPSQVAVSRGSDLEDLLSEHEGEVLLLDIMNTECPPCRASMPELVEVHDEWGGRIEMISISIEVLGFPQNSEEDLESFAEDFGAGWTFVRYDEPAEVIRRFGINAGLPTVVILDQEGREVFNRAGVHTEEVLSERIREVVEGG